MEPSSSNKPQESSDSEELRFGIELFQDNPVPTGPIQLMTAITPQDPTFCEKCFGYHLEGDCEWIAQYASTSAAVQGSVEESQDEDDSSGLDSTQDTEEEEDDTISVFSFGSESSLYQEDPTGSVTQRLQRFSYALVVKTIPDSDWSSEVVTQCATAVEDLVNSIPEEAREVALAELRRRFRKKRTVKRHPQEGLGRKDGFTDLFSNFIEWNK